MDNRSISHTRWKCQYHIVFIPKYRKKVLYGDEEECYLIVGHRNVDAIRDLEKRIGEIESETYYLADQGVRNRLNEYKCERSILRDLRKNVESLLHDLNFTLDYKRLDVEEIWVWGLSCGDVDKPYIEFLRDRYPDAK